MHIELRQRCHSKKIGIGCHIHYRRDAGKQVAHFGRIAHVHVLDGERDFPFGQLPHDVIPVNMRAVEDTEVFPPAMRTAFCLLDDADHIRRLRVLAGKGNRFHGEGGQRSSFFLRVVFTRRLQRNPPVGKCAFTRPKYRRVLVDDGKSTLQNGGGRAPVLAQHDQPGLKKMTAEQMKSRAGCATKTVDGLIRIANAEDVRFGPRERRQNLDLREVGILKFVDENEAGAGSLRGQQLFVAGEHLVRAGDHVAKCA